MFAGNELLQIVLVLNILTFLAGGMFAGRLYFFAA